jgi:hypothetical protein
LKKNCKAEQNILVILKKNCEHKVEMPMCVVMMSDHQEMIKLWFSVWTNHGVSVVLCNMSLGLWCVGAEH